MAKKKSTNVLQNYISKSVLQNTNNVVQVSTGNLVAGGRIHRYWESENVNLYDLSKNRVIGSYYDAFTDATAFVEYFNLHSVEFGNWMSQADRMKFMYAAADSLRILAKVLGVPESAMGLGNRLSVALGARGNGGKFAAHYENLPYAIINISKTHGDSGSFAHEFAHAIDNLTAQLLCGLDNFYQVSGGGADYKIHEDRLNHSNKYISEFENLFKIMYKDKGEISDFARNLSQMGEYFQRRSEVFARMFETWVASKETEEIKKNLMLCKRFKDYDIDIYPFEHIQRLSSRIKNLFNSAILDLANISNKPLNLPKPQPEIIEKPIEKPIEVIDEPKAEKPIEKPKKEKPKLKEIYSDNLIFGKDGKIVTPSETLPMRYAVAELDFIQASNDAFTFAKNEKYPDSCQTRNYNEDVADKTKVIYNADNFDYEHLINNSPDATSGSPIMTDTGIVLGGNGRTMILKRVEAFHKDKYDEYVTALKAISPYLFGISADDIDKFQKPTLVRVIEADLKKCSTYSNILNQSNMQQYDEIREGIATANQLLEKKETVYTIVDIFEKAMGDDDSLTLNDLLDLKTVAQELINALQRADIINKTNINVIIQDKNSFTARGKAFIEAMFLGIILPDKALINTARQYTVKILKAIPDLFRIKTLNGEYNIIPDLQKAIALESSRKASNISIKLFLRQESYLDKPDALVIELFKILNATSQKEFRNFCNFYATSATTNQNHDDIFDVRVMPIDIVAAWITNNPLTLKGVQPEYYGLIEKHINFLYEPRKVVVSFAKETLNIYDEQGEKIIGRIDLDEMRPRLNEDMFGTTNYDENDLPILWGIIRYIKSLKPLALKRDKFQLDMFSTGKERYEPTFDEPVKKPKLTEMQIRRSQTALFDRTKLDDLAFAAYHGTPHKFDKFTTEKIGSGEGAQAFGWGLYFTDKKDIAKWYKEKLSITNTNGGYKYIVTIKGDYSMVAFSRIRSAADIHDGNINKVRDGFIKAKDYMVSRLPYYKEHNINEYHSTLKEISIMDEILSLIINNFVKLKPYKKEAAGSLFKVKIHGDKTLDELNFIRWDKKITDKKTIDKIVKLIDFINRLIDKDSDFFDHVNKNHIDRYKGSEIYQNLGVGLRIYLQSFGKDGLIKKVGNWKSIPELTSKLLLKFGIDGITYPAHFMSGGNNDGYLNYVVFDENAIEIEEINDVPKNKPQPKYDSDIEKAQSEGKLFDRPGDYTNNSLLNDSITDIDEVSNTEVTEVTATEEFLANNEFISDVPVIQSKQLNIKGKVKQLLGQLFSPFSMLVWGKQGSGKSSFALQLADDLSYNGKVLYFANEEKVVAQRIARRALRLGVNTNRFTINDSGNFDEFIRELNSGKYNFVIIDSKDNFGKTENELIIVKDEFPEISFVYISHSTKDGATYVGDRKFAFLTDLEIRFEDGWAEVLKNRDGRSGNKVNFIKSGNANKYRSIYGRF